IAVPLIERETRLLAAVAPTVPLPIPVPEYIGSPSSSYPWPFAGYRRLEGRTACTAGLSEQDRAALAEPPARLVRALHSFPVPEGSDRGAPGDELGRVDLSMRIPKARARLGELVELGLLEPSAAARLEGLLGRMQGTSVAPDVVLLHGDLYARHVLVDS